MMLEIGQSNIIQRLLSLGIPPSEVSGNEVDHLVIIFVAGGGASGPMAQAMGYI